jgi:hypothetical protein
MIWTILFRLANHVWKTGGGEINLSIVMLLRNIRPRILNKEADIWFTRIISNTHQFFTYLWAPYSRTWSRIQRFYTDFNNNGQFWFCIFIILNLSRLIKNKNSFTIVAYIENCIDYNFKSPVFNSNNNNNNKSRSKSTIFFLDDANKFRHDCCNDIYIYTILWTEQTLHTFSELNESVCTFIVAALMFWFSCWDSSPVFNNRFSCEKCLRKISDTDSNATVQSDDFEEDCILFYVYVTWKKKHCWNTVLQLCGGGGVYCKTKLRQSRIFD